jgi:hypothetical protein
MTDTLPLPPCPVVDLAPSVLRLTVGDREHQLYNGGLFTPPRDSCEWTTSKGILYTLHIGPDMVGVAEGDALKWMTYREKFDPMAVNRLESLWHQSPVTIQPD